MYLSHFKNLNFEAWDHIFSDSQTDSLRRTAPSTLLTIVSRKGDKTILPMYPKPITATSLVNPDSSGNVSKYDLDRMYAFAGEEMELVTLQYYVFGKIFVSVDEFDLSKRKVTE
jgi:hypothetical protein